MGRARPGLQGPIRTRSLFATAAVIVMAVVGIASLTLRPTGGPAASASASPSPSPSIAPSSSGLTPGRDGDVLIPAGPYTISTPRYAVHLTMPAGWKAPPGSATNIFKIQTTGYRAMTSLFVTPYQITHVMRDACRETASSVMEPIGPTAADLTTALTNLVGIDRTGPTFVSVGRYPARKFELRLGTDCANQARSFVTDASLTYSFGLNFGETALIYVVDVDGVPLVITGVYGPNTTAGDLSELQAILDSAEVEPVPNPPPLATIGPGGWLPGGPHTLTVDGTPLTFTVPEIVTNRGWNRYGDLSITFDATGPQSAEAIIYWTAFPDGASTDPCPWLNLPRDGTIANLAESVASINGISLIETPQYATVGGYPARYVSFTVEKDRGCDPNFLFTSEPPRGGPGWWKTGTGDTLRVWIVDVHGKRMFIVAELTLSADASLRRQVDDIVASISFG